jgi:hypothetical protein
MLLGRIRNMAKIRKMAKTMGINTSKMKKTDIIRAIQRKENNIDCYGTPRVEYCHEPTCLWRDDCSFQNKKTKSTFQ